MKNKQILFVVMITIIITFPIGFFLGSQETNKLSITSLEDGQIIHSKVVIDAVFPSNIDAIQVKINGKLMANYVPYTWNNLNESVGTYQIEIVGIRNNGMNLSDIKTIVIPTYEIYTPENFTCKEDIVIHRGQTVLWRPGNYSVAVPVLDNGLYPHNVKPVYINVFGNLTMEGVYLKELTDIIIEKGGRLEMINCQIDPINIHRCFLHVKEGGRIRPIFTNGQLGQSWGIYFYLPNGFYPGDLADWEDHQESW